MSKNHRRSEVVFGGLLVVVATGFWATDLFCRYDLLKILDVVSLVWLEHLLALMLMAPLFLSSFIKLFKVPRKIVFSVVFIGLVGSAIGTLSFSYAFFTINPVVPIILQKLQPFVAVLGASVILREKHPPYFFAALLVAVLGAVLLSQPYLKEWWSCVGDVSGCLSRSGTESGASAWMGILGVCGGLVAVVAWGLSTVFGRMASQAMASKDVVFFRYFWGFVGVFLWMLVFGVDARLYGFPYLVTQNPMVGVKLFYMAVGVGLIALLFYYEGMKRVPAKLASVLELFYVVFSVGFAYLFLDQALGLIQIVGMALIVSASLYCTQKGFR